MSNRDFGLVSAAMFLVAGSLRGRGVSVRWLDPPGDPPGVRWRGDGEFVEAIAEAVGLRRTVSPTPVGPFFAAADDPPHVALATAVGVLDETAEVFASGDVPEIPGGDVPAGAVS
jgi:hypothetical protein